MKLDQIFEEWKKDSEIDITELGEESLKIAKLHHKYYQILSGERLQTRKLESEFKVLRLEKFEFYTQGPSKESVEKGWELPAIGKILKSDANNYIDSDKDIISMSLKIGVQHEKLELLDSIIKTIMGRGWNIKNAIDWEKFKMGG
jgi:hypothetical protein